MASALNSITRYLGRHRFAVLGYSADDDVFCPECLRRGAGLSPHRPDSSGRPVIPLFLADPTVREEVCCHCERPLVEALPGIQPPILYKVVRLHRVPGSTIVQHDPLGTLALDQLGRGTLYLNAEGVPLEVTPEAADTEPAQVRGPVSARPPTVHRRTSLSG